MIHLLRAAPQFLRYLVVGGAGFFLDAAGMELLVRAGAPVWSARACSMALAIMATYALHKYFTFHTVNNTAPNARQFSGHVACQLLAGLLNYLVFLCLLRLFPQPVEMAGRLLALCAGVGIGLAANYMLLKRYVYTADADIWGVLKKELLTNRRLWIWGVVALALGIDAFRHQQEVLMIPHLAHQVEPWDPDNWMRLTKVRAWLQGADFYDRSVPMTNAPIGGIETPWTRPMDFIIAFIVRMSPDAYTLNQKLLVAASWVSPLLSLTMLAFLVRAALKCFNNIHVVVCAIALMLCNAVHQNYFEPGNADHHGLLILLWCAVLGFLLQPVTAVSMTAAGVALGGMLWVSPEAMMLIAVVYVVLGLRALLRPQEMPFVALLTLVVAAVTGVAVLAETRPSEYFNYVVYDSVSIVYVCLMSLTAAGAVAVAFAFRRGISLWSRAAIVGAVGAFVLCAFAAAYPKFLQGPLVDADPYIFKYFLPFIEEARPLVRSSLFEVVIRMYMPLLAGFFLFKSCYSPRPFFRSRQMSLLAVILLVTLVMMGFQLRWNYYLQTVSIIVVAVYLPVFAIGARSEGFGWLRRVMRMLRPYVWLCICVLVVSIVSMSAKETNTRRASNGYCQSQTRFLIESGQLESVLGAAPKNIFVSTNVGGDIAFFTPYRIVAGNYHREGRGMSASRDIIAAKTAGQAKPLLAARKIDALLICPSHYPDSSWLYKLSDGHPGWLTRVPQNSLRLMQPAGEVVPMLFKVAR